MRLVIDVRSWRMIADGDSDASSLESDRFRDKFDKRLRLIEFVSRAIRVRNIEIRQLRMMLRPRFEFQWTIYRIQFSKSNFTA